MAKTAPPPAAPAHSTAAAPPPAPKPALRVAGSIRVRATQLGYYDDARRRIGDVFDLHDREGTFTEVVLDKDGEPKTDRRTGAAITKEVKKILTAEEQFSEVWMEKVDPATPEQTTTGAEELRRKHDEELAARQGGGAPTGAGRPLGDD